MTVLTVLLLCVLLEVKHYLCDYTLQHYPYMYENKHAYWHPGGWLHAGIHGVGAMVALTLGTMTLGVAPLVLMALAAVDVLVHHHVDAWKMSKNRAKGWRPDNCHEFWDLLGQDQALHHLTNYALIAALAFL